MFKLLKDILESLKHFYCLVSFLKDNSCPCPNDRQKLN